MSCGDRSQEDFGRFSVNHESHIITYGEREFHYVQDSYFDGTMYLLVYWNYNPLAINSVAPLSFQRESDDSITVFYEENYVPEDWQGYDMMAVAEELLPSGDGFFTELTVFLKNPSGWLFLFGLSFVLFPKVTSLLFFRAASQRRGFVDYDETRHKPIFQILGAVMMAVAVWWFSS